MKSWCLSVYPQGIQDVGDFDNFLLIIPINVEKFLLLNIFV